MFHRTWFAHDLDAFGAQLVASLVNVRQTERNITKAVADIVGVGVPIKGELDDCVGLLRSVADKGVGKTARLVILIGVIFGPFIGALIGELSAQRNLPQAVRAGIGATVGLVLGAALKLALAFAMIGIFIVMRFL